MSLFDPTTLGKISLQNRVVMAPMTRNRSIGNVPNDLVATYYSQRAEAGLIVTEGTSPSPHGLGYPRMPGIFSAEQVEGWKKVTAAVHAKGGKIFVQLMDSGRVGHPLNLPPGARLLGPSAVAWQENMYTDAQGPQPIPVAEEMSEADIAAAIRTFADAAKNAIAAGFDGVELHGANGYLIDQFLNTASNQRTDRWGGSVENRARFAIEVARATAAAIGGERVGIRLSPFGVFNGMRPDPEMVTLYRDLCTRLSMVGLIYVHIVDHSSMGAPPVPRELKAEMRDAFGGVIVLSGGYDAARAEADLADGLGHLVAFGRPFISNPRLVTRMREGLPLAQPDFTRLYTPGEQGYTDYPVD